MAGGASKSKISRWKIAASFEKCQFHYLVRSSRFKPNGHFLNHSLLDAHPHRSSCLACNLVACVYIHPKLGLISSRVMYKTGTKATSATASSVRPVGKTATTGTGNANANKENGKNNKEDASVRAFGDYGSAFLCNSPKLHLLLCKRGAHHNSHLF